MSMKHFNDYATVLRMSVKFKNNKKNNYWFSFRHYYAWTIGVTPCFLAKPT